MATKTIDPFFKRFFILLILFILVFLLYEMASVITSFVCAFILAYLFNPLVKRISKVMPRWLAIIVVYSSITLGFGILLWWLLPSIWVQLQAGWNYLPKLVNWYNNEVRSLLTQYTRLNLPLFQSDILSDTFVEYLNKNYDANDAQSLFLKIMNSGLIFINNAGFIVLVPILTFYFLFSWDKRLQTWKEALPLGYKDKIVEITKDCDSALMAFVKGQLLVMVLLGIIYAVQLQLIGLELGLIIGMVAGIASFVPYLGFGIGFISAIIAGLFQFGLDWVHLSLIVAAFLVGQAAEGYILQPLLLGDKIGLSPLWVIFSVLAGAALLGFVGMLIALPVSAILNVLFLHAFDAYKKSEFYKGNRQYKLFD